MDVSITEESSIVSDLEALLASLEYNQRSNKLPSALFESLLSALFDMDSSGNSVIDRMTIDSSGYRFKTITYENHFFDRFLIRLVASQFNRDSGVKLFLLTVFDRCLLDSTLTSCLLKACDNLMKWEEFRAWIHSNGLLIKIVNQLRSNNIYVCRNASKALRSYLKMCHESQQDLIAEPLHLLFENLLRFGTHRSNGIDVQNISENCAFESAGVILEASESISNQRLHGNYLSIDECKILIDVAVKHKRLQDSYIGVYCLFSKGSFDSEILGNKEIIGRVSLKRLKLQFDDALLRAALEPIMTPAGYFGKISAYIALVSRFVETTKFDVTQSPLLLDCCVQIIAMLLDAGFYDSSGAICMKLITNAVKAAAHRETSLLYAETVLPKLHDLLLLRLQRENVVEDNVIADIVQAYSVILAHYCSKNQLCPCVLLHSEKFVTVCLQIETTPISFSAAMRFTSIEAFVRFLMAFIECKFECAETVLSNLKAVVHLYIIVVAETLSTFASSGIFSSCDIIIFYGHASRFHCITEFLLAPYLSNDSLILTKIFQLLPLDEINHLISFAFPALRRSVIAYVIVSSYFSNDYNLRAPHVLTEHIEHFVDEPDPFVGQIFGLWQSNRANNLGLQDRLWLKNVISNITDVKRNEPFADLTGIEKLSRVSRICKDVLSFLHSNDDTPCVLIGDGDQDGLDCEES